MKPKHLTDRYLTYLAGHLAKEHPATKRHIKKIGKKVIIQ